MDNEIYATYLIPQSRLEGLQKLFDKLGRRIAKGKTTADYAPTIEATREVILTSGLRKFNPLTCTVQKPNLYEYVWVTIKYQQPVISGWQLVAVYDWETAEDGTRTCYTSVVPDQIVPKHLRDVHPADCDHCGHNRRRKQLILVTKGHREFKVVGSTCVKDFLGHTNPNSLMDFYKFETSIGEYFGGGFEPAPTVALHNVVDVLTIAAMDVAKRGYKKAGDWDHMPTAHYVDSYINSIERYWAEERQHVKPTDTHRETAKAAMEWALEQSDASDYMANVHKAIGAGAISHKRFGVVCSVVHIYNRYLERLDRESRTSNEWIGTPKERIRGLIANVIRVRHLPNAYDGTTMIAFKTDAGDELVWFASGYHDVEAGERWRLDATVKEHKTFNETRQTVLTRVKYSDISPDKYEAVA